MKEVEPGDTCYLEKGDYYHDGLTRIHGTKDKRITITGHKSACIKGSNTQDRVLQIAHDYYTVKGICFDGKHDDDNYVATAIYVLGADKKTTKNGVTSSVTGFQMFDNKIKVRDLLDVDDAAAVLLSLLRLEAVAPRQYSRAILGV